MDISNKILPVILSGGSGLRLWPLSRRAMPKQFQKILGNEKTFLQEALERVKNPEFFSAPLIIGHEDHRFIIQENATQIGTPLSGILLEPEVRDTAAAVITAALWADNHSHKYILVLPSDHLIGDTTVFQSDITKARDSAGDIVYFGIEPDHPHTGYGYIRSDAAGNVCSFHEKPDKNSAEKLIASGAFWNSGIFLIPVKIFLEQMKNIDPSLLEKVDCALKNGKTDLNFFRLDSVYYGMIPKIAFDKAYCERHAAGKVFKASFPWSDIGCWDSVHDHSEKNADNSFVQGNVITTNATNSLISSDGILLGVSGVDNLVVVATKDAVLVAGKDGAQDIRTLVEKMKESGKPQVDNYFIVHRPWGSYEVMNETSTFRVIRMRIKPEGKLSLQLHRQRSEHWVVVSGELTVTKDGKTGILTSGQSNFAAPCEKHRLENQGSETVEFIEVQTGVILDNDIERFDQVY